MTMRIDCDKHRLPKVEGETKRERFLRVLLTPVEEDYWTCKECKILSQIVFY